MIINFFILQKCKKKRGQRLKIINEEQDNREKYINNDIDK